MTRLLIMFGLLVLTPTAARYAVAADDVPIRVQAGVLQRVLVYDRARQAPRLAVGVLHRHGIPESDIVRADIVEALSQHQRFMQIEVIPLDWTNTRQLEKDIEKHGLRALYVCPGLADGIPEITAVTRKRSVLTLSAKEAYVRDGVAVGVVRRGTRPTLLIDLKAAKAEGADLDPDMLELAEVL